MSLVHATQLDHRMLHVMSLMENVNAKKDLEEELVTNAKMNIMETQEMGHVNHVIVIHEALTHFNVIMKLANVSA